MKRRPRNSRAANSNNLSFQRLEDRRLLAGDVMGAHQVAGLLPTGANVVVNGDFETFVAGADNFFDESEVDGWNAIDASTGQEINLFNYNVAGFDSVLDLDSTTTDFDRVYQDVSTEVSTEYLVAFDYRSHPTFDPSATEFTHDFEVWWDGSLVGRFTGGDVWNTSVIKVTSGSLDATRLLFCEIQEPGAAAGDGRGALLDNIRVVKAFDQTITNGSFETTTGESSVFYKSADVPGWTSGSADVGSRLIQIDTVDSSDGAQHLNLDTTGDNRDIVSTDLATTAGSSYYVVFDMKTDGEQTTNPDELRVRWNGLWATTIHATSSWETYGVMLTADSSQTQLMFLEPGESSGDGSGPLIDNVRVYEVQANAVQIDANGEADGVDDATVYFPGAGAQAIGQNITLTHPTDGDFDSVVVTLGGAADGSSELVSIAVANIPNDGFGDPKITVTGYDSSTQTLTLTGAATALEYQGVLRSLTYFNAASDITTTSRLVNIVVNDSTIPGEFGTAEAAIDVSIETDQVAIDGAILTKFIADNNLVTTNLGNGLYAVIDTPGTGQNPTINSTVRVKYNGKFIELNDQNKLVEGESFDFSSDEGITFPLTNVIQGWQIGIPVFKTGGAGQLLIPSHLAYGSTGQGGIGPNTVLVFDVELLEIVV